MENRKDIGKVFNEKLHALEKSPSNKVWNNISIELQKKKKRRIGFFFFWTKITGLFIIGALTAWYVYEHQSDNSSVPNGQKESITVNEDHSNTNRNNTAEDKENVTQSNDTSLNGNNKASEDDKTKKLNFNRANSRITINNNRTSKHHLSEKNTASKKSKISKGKSGQFSKTKFKNSTRKKKTKLKISAGNKDNEGLALNQSSVASPDLSSLQNGNKSGIKEETPVKKKDSLAAKKEKDKVKNITMQPEDKKEQDSAKTYRKFEVDVFASPTHYGYFSNESTLDRRLDSLSKKSDIKWSYGIGLSYELTEKVTVRIGYTKTNLSFTTENVSINTTNYSGISYKPNITNATIYAQSGNAEKMDITQKISYTEIPLEVKYKFLNNKLSLDGLFGFSYLALNENTVNIKTDNGFSQEIGTTKHLSKTSISANLGVGLSYEIFKNTKLIAEPMFNYQVKAFDNNNYKAYYFGIHTGIRYTFLNK